MEGSSCSEPLNARVASYDNEPMHDKPTMSKFKFLMNNKLIWHLWLTVELKLTHMMLRSISYFKMAKYVFQNDKTVGNKSNN